MHIRQVLLARLVSRNRHDPNAGLASPNDTANLSGPVLGKLRNKREEPVVGSDSVIQTLRDSFSSVSKPMLAKFVHFSCASTLPSSRR